MHLFTLLLLLILSLEKYIHFYQYIHCENGHFKIFFLHIFELALYSTDFLK